MKRFFMATFALLSLSGAEAAHSKWQQLNKAIEHQLGVGWNMARLAELRNLESEMLHIHPEEGNKTTTFLQLALPSEHLRLNTWQDGQFVASELSAQKRLFYTPKFGTVPLPKRHAAMLRDESRRREIGFIFGLKKAEKIAFLGQQRWIDDPRFVLEGQTVRILWPESDGSLTWDYLLDKDGRILAERFPKEPNILVLHGPRRPEEGNKHITTYIELNKDSTIAYEEEQQGTVRLRANVDLPSSNFEVLP